MAKTQTPIAQVSAPDAGALPDTHTAPTNPDLCTAAQLGTAFAKSALRDVSDLQSFAVSVKVRDAHTGFAAYSAFALEFKAAAESAGWSASQDLWERTWLGAKNCSFLPDRPKSDAPAAVKKATDRGAAKAKIAAAIKGKTPLELSAEAGKLAAAGKLDEAAHTMSLAKTAQREIDKAAKDKAAAAIKPLHQRIGDAVKRLEKAGDIKALQQIAVLALKLSPVPKAEAISK